LQRAIICAAFDVFSWTVASLFLSPGLAVVEMT
jgi:hypothetical protein